MRKGLFAFAAACFFVATCLAQVGGSSVYNQGGRNQGKTGAENNEIGKRAMTATSKPPSANSIFLDASILINVKADEYVAVFGISLDGATIEECNQKVDSTISQFRSELGGIGIRASDIDVDYVSQNRTYAYEVSGELAKEKQTGFELKKNVAIHYRERMLLDRLLAAAAKSQIFDLIKVDYVVTNIGEVHTRLMEAAAKVIKQKAGNHARLLGIKLQASPQIYTESYTSYAPTDMYDSYAAFESEDVSGGYNRQIQRARKVRTFYYNGLDAKNFDEVINPVVVEPKVQFTLYLRLKYLMAAPAPAPTKPNKTYIRLFLKALPHALERKSPLPLLPTCALFLQSFQLD